MTLPFHLEEDLGLPVAGAAGAGFALKPSTYARHA
jgi:hypothetical protein